MLSQNTTLLTIAHNRPAVLEHHFQAYLDNGKPANHVVWVNGYDAGVWQVVQRFNGLAPMTVVRAPMIGLHNIVDIVSEFIETEYLFLLTDDFRVTRPTWMEEFAVLLPADAVGVPGASSRSDNGVLKWLPPGVPWACPPHLRTGGLLLRVAAFKATGKFSPDGVVSWQEVRLTRKMLAMGMRVKVIEDAPFYDYGHWGRNHWPGISSGTLAQLKEFDVKFGVKAQSTTY
jgi:hypothetical protein